MKKITFVLILILLFINARAQQKVVDSLNKLIATAKDDTNKVLLINKLSRILIYSKADSALLLAQQSLHISETIKFLKGSAFALNNEGSILTLTGNYPKALTCYLAALKINEQRGDRQDVAKNLGNIGVVYSYEGDYRQCVNYSLKAKIISATVHNEITLQSDLNNLGDAYEKLNILDSALLYTRQANVLAVKLVDGDKIGITFNNLGNIYSKMHRTDSAMYYYRRSIYYYKKENDDDGICESALGMAKIFSQQGQSDSSLYYARESIAKGWSGGFTARVLNASQFLTGYFEKQGRLDSAFRYQKMSITAKDSLFSQEKAREIQDLSLAERQRQQDIEEKEVAYKTSVRYYLLTAVIIFLLVMAMVLWKNNKQNKKAKTQIQHALDELKTTQTQLVQREKMASLGELTAGIAHEIQNPLNFVNNFSDVNREMIDELKDALKRKDFEEALVVADDIQQNEEKINHHGKRADFIVKGMLQHSRTSTGEKQLTDINVLADEFLKLSYHGLRAKDKNFNAELITHFDEKLPKVNIAQQDIGRVLLNLFNNAFYAVNQKQKTSEPDYKPEVIVSTSVEKNNLVISVKDNGNGIPDNIKEKIMQPFFTTKPTGEGTGLGLSLSYDIVVKGHGGKISVDTKENEFTAFTVWVPIA